MSLVLDSVVIALLSLSPSAPAVASAPKPAAASPAPAAASAPAQKPATASGIEPAPKAAKPAMAPDVKALVDRMQGFYEKTTDFTAHFTQQYTYKAFKRTTTSSGTVTFKKPALMRWEYEKPSPRTFVLAGENVYALDPEARTLTKTRIGTNQLSASVTFLWGRGRLADEFAITKAACSTCKGVLLELTPLQPDPRFRKAKLEVDPKTAQVLRSIVVDPDGSENVISFEDLKTNQGVSDNFFKVVQPPDYTLNDLTKGQ